MGRRSGGGALRLAVIGLAVLVLIGLTWLVLRRARDGAPGATGGQAAVGPADDCRTQPRFVGQLGLGERAGFTTGWDGTVGLAVVEPTGEAGQARVYQHPSWASAGHLGPHVTDRFGNLYVAPFPRRGSQWNPPAEQNRVYRVDTDRQELSLLVELDPGGPLSELSPIGVVGLAYDCDSDSLYAASLAGSTATEEVGRIYRIDLRRGQVADVYDHLDAAGIAAFRTAKGKQLYLGSTRLPRLLSLALNEQGGFVGKPRVAIDFGREASDDRTTAYQIRFPAPQTMELALVDFRGSAAASSPGAEATLRYAYDEVRDRWQRQP